MGKRPRAFAENVAVDTGLPVGVFSMEMGGTRWPCGCLPRWGGSTRRTCAPAHVRRQWSGSPRPGKTHEAPICIDRTGGLSPPACAPGPAVWRASTAASSGLIVIDYIQLMSTKSPGRKPATEVEISRSIKSLARNCRCRSSPFRSFSRKVEERNDKRPMMSDLRESGAIEQDADVIPDDVPEEYYKPDTPTRASPRSSSASSVTAPPAPYAWPSWANTRVSRTSPRGHISNRPGRLPPCCCSGIPGGAE